MEFLFQVNGVKGSYNYENLLHGKWSNFVFNNTKKIY